MLTSWAEFYKCGDSSTAFFHIFCSFAYGCTPWNKGLSCKFYSCLFQCMSFVFKTFRRICILGSLTADTIHIGVFLSARRSIRIWMGTFHCLRCVTRNACHLNLSMVRGAQLFLAMFVKGNDVLRCTPPIAHGSGYLRNPCN